MWLVIAFPLTAVIVGFVSLALAIRSDDGMVEDDYYKQGMTINRMLDRDKAAAAEGLTATVELDAARHELLSMTAPSAACRQHSDQVDARHARRLRSAWFCRVTPTGLPRALARIRAATGMRNHCKRLASHRSPFARRYRLVMRPRRLNLSYWERGCTDLRFFNEALVRGTHHENRNTVRLFMPTEITLVPAFLVGLLPDALPRHVRRIVGASRSIAR
jgi:hypothetical protein